MALLDLTARNALIAEASVTAIVPAARIYTTTLPEKTPKPAISILFVDEVPENQLTGTAQTVNQKVDINLMSVSKTDIANLITAVETAMTATGFKVGMQDLSELENGFYRYALTYSIFS